MDDMRVADSVGIQLARVQDLLEYVIECVAFLTCQVLICLRSITFRYLIGQNLVGGRLFASV